MAGSGTQLRYHAVLWVVGIGYTNGFPEAVLETDEWRAFARVAKLNLAYATVDHAVGKADRNGMCKVYVNTTEGTWTGMRNYFRLFRGMSKPYLACLRGHLRVGEQPEARHR